MTTTDLDLTGGVDPEAIAHTASDPEAFRQRLVADFKLKENAEASDIIQHVIDKSGHLVSLMHVVALAQMLDADIQLTITNNESVPPHAL